jgi:hypothetical protein
LVPAGGGSECGAFISLTVFFHADIVVMMMKEFYLSFFWFSFFFLSFLTFRSAEISFTVSPAFGKAAAAAAAVTSWPPMVVAGRKS